MLGQELVFACPAGVDMRAPQARLAFAAGPLPGINVPGTSRLCRPAGRPGLIINVSRICRAVERGVCSNSPKACDLVPTPGYGSSCRWPAAPHFTVVPDDRYGYRRKRRGKRKIKILIAYRPRDDTPQPRYSTHPARRVFGLAGVTMPGDGGGGPAW